MATGTIALIPAGATLPDGTTNNAAPGIARFKSSATPPGIYDIRLAFDASTEEWAVFKGVVPADFSSGTAPTAKVKYVMTSATAGGVAPDVRIAAMSDNDASVAAKPFSTANVGTATVPASAGTIDIVSITLTNRDNMAAGDALWVYLGRAVANGADTATGDMELVDFSIEYTTA